LPATNAKRLRKGAQATKQSTFPPDRFWIASLALAMTTGPFVGLVRKLLVALCLVIGPVLGPTPAWAEDRIGVVTTTTDLRSLTEAVGGDLVEAVSLVPPNFDAEQYQPKPQDALRLKNARLVVRVGLDYDLWFDSLLNAAAARELRRGGAGYVDASFGIAPLEVRGVAIGPGDGHAHGSGNPHYWLDPENAGFITANIMEGLARIDPAHTKTYEANRQAFLARLSAKLTEWEAKLAPLKSMPIIAYHNSWPYFARRFRLDFAEFLEIKPGVPSTPSHLAAIIDTMRSRNARLVVREPHEPERDVAFVAAKTGASVVVLAASVGAMPGATDYLSLFDTDIAALLDAAGVR
jgi:ABC-type Zn uptake system ZnuABC Zn-binding protein ZnuA